MDKNGFFIGWQEKLPGKSRSAIIKLLLIFILISIALITLFVLNQSKFNDHFFRFGQISEVTGVYHDAPVPILRVTDGSLDEGVSPDLLLVGYGKSGAEGIMQIIQSQHGALEGKTITIQGSLIYGDGKSVLELTKKDQSLVNINEDDIVVSPPGGLRSEREVQGEILDPKCYFGVMKPGEGKIHKSCAIRCISGGIPPVLRSTINGQNQYFIITAKDGSKINEKVLDFIAEPVKIKGMTYEIHGWKILEINPSDIEIL